jgi:hypothetical protein
MDAGGCPGSGVFQRCRIGYSGFFVPFVPFDRVPRPDGRVSFALFQVLSFKRLVLFYGH